MSVAPKLKDYDIKVLIALGNQTRDSFTYNYIKFIIVDKILSLNCPRRLLIRMFIRSSNILKEAYAETIVMTMKDEEYYINDIIISEVVKLVSIDTLMFYGMESKSIKLYEKSKEEFWDRVMKLENKAELIRKKNLDNVRVYRIMKKKKGD